ASVLMIYSLVSEADSASAGCSACSSVSLATRGSAAAASGGVSPEAFSRLKAGKVIIPRQADFFPRLRSNAFNRLKLLRRHISQCFDRGHTGCIQFFYKS